MITFLRIVRRARDFLVKFADPLPTLSTVHGLTYSTSRCGPLHRDAGGIADLDPDRARTGSR